MRHLITRLAAAAVTVAAAGAGVVGTSTPAAAAACSGATGVTVVVDHGSLGGGIDQICSAGGGGKSATSLFTGAGYALTYVQRQPGFVCRINGAPASDPCVNTPPADAYWGLWWSDGKSGSWTYSSIAAGSLNVPDGGYVAFAWQSGSKAAPGVPATAHPASATPTATPTSGGGGAGSATPTTKPTSKPSSKPSDKPSTKPSSKPSSGPATAPTTAGPTATSGSTSAAPDQTGSASPSATEDASDSASPTTPESATESADVTATDTSETPDPTAQAGETAAVEEDSALPAWVVPAVLVLLAIGGGAAYLLRRRDRPGP